MENFSPFFLTPHFFFPLSLFSPLNLFNIFSILSIFRPKNLLSRFRLLLYFVRLAEERKSPQRSVEHLLKSLVFLEIFSFFQRWSGNHTMLNTGEFHAPSMP
ncbi:MAG: hypothetical protein D6679_04270 [Candidatus Hydrogenedentota bacterium]|nr:MAG: hypothetical protein D6679_04270 [Candidatus Hydrogenedentota bacterium]